MGLRFQVTCGSGEDRFEHQQGPIEFGRGPRGAVPRFVVHDPSMSRDQLRVEELPGGRIRVENLSSTQAVGMADGEDLATGQSREVEPPVCLTVRRTRISIERNGSGNGRSAPALTAPRQPDAGSDGTNHTRAAEGAPAAPAGGIAAEASAGRFDEADQGLVAFGSPNEPPQRSGLDAGAAPATGTIERLTEWLHTIVELQKAAPGSEQFFRQTAQAMLDLIGMDTGLVLLRSDHGWKVAAAAGAGARTGSHYSRTMVDYVAANRQTFYQDLERMAKTTLSLARIEAAVAAPIFGLNDEIAGVLYGARSRGLFARGPIGPLEAQLVQLLAASVGANLARSTALRTRVQFEQFFSPELVRELEQNPDLLEGRSQDVTLVFSDLRGFTALSQRLGAERTCRMVRDMMEALSEQIVAHGGVIVDYAGDGILAMWNAPTEQPDHALRACRAAVAMLGELPQINQHWGQEAGDALSLGIGINTGLAQVGNTGCARKFKYGPHGHTVNLASRVQDATKLLGLPLLVTGAVRDLLPDAMHTRRLGQVRLPGVEKPAVLYELKGERPSDEWRYLRDTYEKGLALYEAGEWSRACQVVAPLLPSAGDGEKYDIPTLKLLRRAWECLEIRPDPFVPILDVSTK
jgi:adenylate cyclase